MEKMLFELKAPLHLARAKEDLGVDNIFKYLRYYRMYLDRFKWEVDGVDYSQRIEHLLFWRGQCALVKDVVYGLIVGEIDEKQTKYNPNGFPTKITISAENGYKKKDIEVGKDAVILYADSTRIAPVIYIWSIANKIIEREDIIDQQDNMLRKPIVITGEGAELDNAIAKAINTLSGVAWFNLNPKDSKTKGGNIMQDKPLEVLNLQTGNAYKGGELWDSRKHFEELICDYLGYITVKNEKKERMNTSEVNNDNSIGKTFYMSAKNLREDASKKVKEVLGINLKLTKILEVEQNDSKEDVETTDKNEQ